MSPASTLVLVGKRAALFLKAKIQTGLKEILEDLSTTQQSVQVSFI